MVNNDITTKSVIFGKNTVYLQNFGRHQSKQSMYVSPLEAGKGKGESIQLFSYIDNCEGFNDSNCVTVQVPLVLIDTDTDQCSDPDDNLRQRHSF